MHWEPLEGHPDTYVTRWGDGRVMSIRVDNPTTAKLRSIRLRSLAGSRQWRESVPVWFGRSAAETPDEFYARVGALHRSLVTSDPHRPTALLAAMAGVPDGTAAAWVNRAKTRGVY